MRNLHYPVLLYLLICFVGCSKYEYDDKIDVSRFQDTDTIRLKDTNNVLLFSQVNSRGIRQGCAYYQGTLFVFHNTNDVVEIYDLEQRNFMGVIDMERRGYCNNEYHCNNANFGNMKYMESDYYPLLYVSMENINQHKILVFRVQSKNNDNNDIEFDLVQTIILPEPSMISLYYPNCYIDKDKHKLWVSGYSNNSYISAPDNHLKYCCFDIPGIENGQYITLTPNDICAVVVNSCITATQGGYFDRGILYQVFGTVNPRYFVAFNLYKDQLLYKIPFSNDSSEPEGLFVNNDTVFYTTRDEVIKINFSLD